MFVNKDKQIILISGAIMPLGPKRAQGTVPYAGNKYRCWQPEHSEYIVKDSSRILPVMLVAFKQ